MKRLCIGVLALAWMAVALPASAQESSVVTLDDASPQLEVQVTLPPNSTGALALDLNMAMVTLNDSRGETVFHAADSRIRGLEINIAPNTGAHTLMVERLPGAARAAVRVHALSDLTSSAVTQLAEHVSTDRLSFDQQRSVALTPEAPGSRTTLNVPEAATGLITVTYSGMTGTMDLFDAAGVRLARAVRDVDGVNLIVAAGQYQVSLATDGSGQGAEAGLVLTDAQANGFTLLSLPEAPAVVEAQPQATACMATVDAVAANVRSGPGTGYTVIGYALLDQQFLVGGINPEHNWLVITGAQGSAWVSSDLMRLSGDCSTLPEFNVPLRDAQTAPQVRGDDDDHEGFERGESSEHEGFDD